MSSSKDFFSSKPVNGKKVKKTDKKRIKIALIAAALVVAMGLVGLGGFFLVDKVILIDTPYDTVRLPKHIQIPTYIGAELSNAAVEKEYETAKDNLIAEFTEKKPVESGKIEEGQNVVISITAYNYADGKKGAKIDSACVSAKEIAGIKKYDLENLPKDEGDIFFPEVQNLLIGVDFGFDSDYRVNMAPDLDYTYPADYNVAALKGKRVLHEIYISSVTEDVEPEWNDALFANNIAKIDEALGVKMGFTTVKEYEEYMHQQIRLNLLWNNLNNGANVIAWPEKHIKKYEEEFQNYYNSVMESNSLTFDKLLQQLGTDEAGFLKTKRSYAEGIVKEEMILYEIIKAEKIRLSGDEYDEGLEKVAKESGMSVDEFIESYGKDVAKRTVIWEYVKAYLLERAKIVD